MNAKHAHTPGPWTLQDDELGVCWLNPHIEAGKNVADPTHDNIIARCDPGVFGSLRQFYEAKANARLISKACFLPEVEEVLEAFCTAYRNAYHNQTHPYEAREKAAYKNYKAIQKAAWEDYKAIEKAARENRKAAEKVA